MLQQFLPEQKIVYMDHRQQGQRIGGKMRGMNL